MGAAPQLWEWRVHVCVCAELQVQIWVCLHVCVTAYTCVHMYVCRGGFAHTHVHPCRCLHVQPCANSCCTHLHVCMHMYKAQHEYLHVCMTAYVCAHTHVHVCMYAGGLHVHSYMCLCTFASAAGCECMLYVHPCAYTQLLVQAWGCLHVCDCVYVCACTYVCVHTCICAEVGLLVHV